MPCKIFDSFELLRFDMAIQHSHHPEGLYKTVCRVVGRGSSVVSLSVSLPVSLSLTDPGASVSCMQAQRLVSTAVVRLQRRKHIKTDVYKKCYYFPIVDSLKHFNSKNSYTLYCLACHPRFLLLLFNLKLRRVGLNLGLNLFFRSPRRSEEGRTAKGNSQSSLERRTLVQGHQPLGQVLHFGNIGTGPVGARGVREGSHVKDADIFAKQTRPARLGQLFVEHLETTFGFLPKTFDGKAIRQSLSRGDPVKVH
jgi:hypothetical protein